jgi:hypothetical protein
MMQQLLSASSLLLLAGALAASSSLSEGAPLKEAAIPTSESDYSGTLDDKNDLAELEYRQSHLDEKDETGRSEGARNRFFRASEYTCSVLRDLDLDLRVEFLESCPGGALAAEGGPECDAGSVALEALWVQRLQDDGSYGEAELVADAGCVTPADVAAEAERAFAELGVEAPVATIQAARPLLVNVHYPVQADAGPVEEEFTLLGVPVLLRAEPARFAWDFDDPHTPGGGVVVTTDPGRRWVEGMDRPDGSWVGHRYTHLGHPDTDPGTLVDAEGDWYRDGVSITLTTTWRGMFQLVGTSEWTDIDGTISTTSSIDPVLVTEARVRLVCSDLDGNRTC